MPGSSSDFDLKVLWYLRYILSSATVLDVGAGQGKWATLLRPYFDKLDGIEVWPAYIEQYQLRQKYRNLFEGLAQDILPGLPDYDVIVLGAVLEHFNAEDGPVFLDLCLQKARYSVIVIVPYQTPQGAVHGNMYERHLQTDLTPDVMAVRYPALRPLQTNAKRGLYIGSGKLARKHQDKP